MKTVIVNIPEKKERLLTSFLKRNRFKAKVLSEDDLENENAIAKWIDEGMDSEELPAEKLYAFLRKHGVDC